MIILAIGYYAFNIEPKKLTVHDYKLEKKEAETTNANKLRSLTKY